MHSISFYCCSLYTLANIHSFLFKTHYNHLSNMDTDYDYLFKVVVIGDAGVGKTCVVKRYCDGGFSDTGIPTIGVDFSIKTLKIGAKTLKVTAE